MGSPVLNALQTPLANHALKTFLGDGGVLLDEVEQRPDVTLTSAQLDCPPQLVVRFWHCQRVLIDEHVGLRTEAGNADWQRHQLARASTGQISTSSSPRTTW